MQLYEQLNIIQVFKQARMKLDINNMKHAPKCSIIIYEQTCEHTMPRWRASWVNIDIHVGE